MTMLEVQVPQVTPLPEMCAVTLLTLQVQIALVFTVPVVTSKMFDLALILTIPLLFCTIVLSVLTDRCAAGRALALKVTFGLNRTSTLPLLLGAHLL